MVGPDIQSEITALAEVAVQHAQETYQTKLDYSPESLQLVEDILAKLYATLPKGILSRLLSRRPKPEQITRMVSVYRAYIGEVIRSRWGGEWSTQSVLYVEPTITLHIGGGEIYPLAKVHKRLTNGPEDNIWFYYMVLARDYQQ